MPLAVFRTRQNRVGAMYAQCAHMGADLSRGQIVGERLQCPLHHWEYNTCGHCEHIPGHASIPARARQIALRCEEHYGLVFVFWGDGPMFDFPHFPGLNAAVWSKAFVAQFDAPYQVLIANAFDEQHFAPIHQRELLEPPSLTTASPYHLCIQFKARVAGKRASDQFMRALGVKVVEISINCWGGNTLLIYNNRSTSYILATLLPISGAQSRVFITTVTADRGGNAVARLARQVILGIAHSLTLAFLKPDIAVLQGLEFLPGVLLPDADRTFIEWVKYWKALPAFSVPANLKPSLQQNAPAKSSEYVENI